MYNFDDRVTYHLPVNPGGEDESITVEMLCITGSPPCRLALLRKFLKFKYGLTRTQANKTTVAMGFTDLIPEQAPCKS